MRSSVAGIGLVLVVGIVLRFAALGHGIPPAPGGDEPEIMDRVIRMMKTGDFNPHFFSYPGFYLYVQVVVGACRFLWGAASGLWTSLDQIDPAAFYVWGRAVTAAIGSATVFVVYAIGSRWGSRPALLAAGLMAVIPTHVRESHYVLGDVPMTFFVALAFLLTLRAHERGTLGALASAGAAAGLAAGTAYYGGAALLLPVAAVSMTPVLAGRRGRGLLVTLASAAAAFVLVAPCTLTDLPGFLDAVAASPPGVAGVAAGRGAGWLFYLQRLQAALWWPGSILLVGGFGLAFVRAFKEPGRLRFALLVVFPLAYFWFISTREFLVARHLLPILPFVSLLVAIAVVSGVSLLRRFDIPRTARTLLIVTGTVAALLPPLVTSIGLVRHHGARLDRDDGVVTTSHPIPPR